MSDFKQTVDLKKKMEDKSKEKSFSPRRPVKKVNKLNEIDEVFSGRMSEKESSNEYKNISRPVRKKENSLAFRQLLFLVGAGLILALFYFGIVKKEGPAEKASFETKWYLVKLVNDEIFYGKIGDTEADPIVVESVYYNYDQGKEDGEKTSNLRLVKRGKETHGPDGTLDIVRTQVVYMEPLREDSKVLEAISEYEK